MSLSPTRRIAVLLACFFLLTSQSFAQLFFTPGYVVTATGDTLKGELREQSSQLLQFRQNEQSATQDYTPAQLASYFADNANRVAVHLKENGQVSSYFMYELLDGYVSLYRLFSPEGRLTHALRLPDKTFVPLRGKLSLLMLTNSLKECSNPSFTRLLSPQSFYVSDVTLKRIVSAYNACVRPDQVAKQSTKKKKMSYELGLSAGIARNHWAYGRSGQLNATYYDPSGSYSPTYTAAVGGFFTIAPRKRLSASVELTASWYSGNRNVPLTDPLEPAKKASRLYSFKESYISLPFTARYVFINKRMRWYVKAGLGPTLTTIRDANFVSSDLGMTIPVDILNRTNIGIGYLAGVGTNFIIGKNQPIYVEARAMPHAVLDGVTNIATSHSYQLNVNIPLIKRY
ncbi:porin family protein [Spirosoma rhododendri]|uniref:PorT family protein n=1 Tax=Spirosoma rhododendri TaxID=2728024 RepID=A0A7L5DH26_9BACT|nr:outer membrane beta-barrel protein [Spirosoma rhododendri]QJD77539.1 PorT family protein [Spirosoma rhododendri]